MRHRHRCCMASLTLLRTASLSEPRFCTVTRARALHAYAACSSRTLDRCSYGLRKRALQALQRGHSVMNAEKVTGTLPNRHSVQPCSSKRVGRRLVGLPTTVAEVRRGEGVGSATVVGRAWKGGVRVRSVT